MKEIQLDDVWAKAESGRRSCGIIAAICSRDVLSRICNQCELDRGMATDISQTGHQTESILLQAASLLAIVRMRRERC